jgi:hypothetical protein
MANDFATSGSGIETALNNINTKKSELETQASNVANAFTELTTTVQLRWLNTLISESWNSRGNAIVENAQGILSTLNDDLKKALETADQINN